MNKIIKRIMLIIGILAVVGIIIVLGINLFVKNSVKDKIVDENSLDKNYDAILVLGAGLRNGKPSPVLKDRLDMAYKLYEDGYNYLVNLK